MGLNSFAENSRVSSLNFDGSLTGLSSEPARYFSGISLLSVLSETQVTYMGGVSYISDPLVLIATIPFALG